MPAETCHRGHGRALRHVYFQDQACTEPTTPRSTHRDVANAAIKRYAVGMYAKIVERICRKAFLAVNRQEYEVLLSMCDPMIVHRFGGSHALGGTRHTRDDLRLWFGRLQRIVPRLVLTIDDIWVKGGPWNTTAIVRWTSTGTPLDGEPYVNHGVHIVRMRWGTAVSIDANEDSQAVADLLRRQVACGIAEAGEPPIES